MATRQLTGFRINTESQLFLVTPGQIERSQLWWDRLYPYRREITLTATPDGLNLGHPVTVFVPKQIVDQNKALSSLFDLEVAFLVDDVPETWLPIPIKIDLAGDFFRITFLLQEDIPPGETNTKYYVYYGNSGLLYRPLRGGIGDIDWPLTAALNSPMVSYTRPGNHWVDGFSDTPAAKATFQFWGPQARVLMGKGPSYGIVEVQVDDSAWERYDLYSGKRYWRM